MPKKPELPPLNIKGEKIGEIISRIRKSRGLTQEQLAKKIGIKRVLLSNYEIGRLRIYDEMIKRIALILEVSADKLLGINIKEKKK